MQGVSFEVMNDPKPKFAFLQSPRFWQLALVGLATGLTVYDQTTNWITALNAAIGIWFGGSVLVGTYDRGQDKKAEAAQLG